ncbi:MAG: hypothetical protein PUB12_07475 [[Clostridium] aminophilum]|uniref:hypothetical protein n=1 Tax=[Clostridium] aminophilum TaxID=1526 RepID=UPI0026F29554|nr:hypothetical protein [[Clostridium] aminophilum]MDD6196712.1 hypothetical protein [[Clostridium] aminophilum]
MNEQNQNPAAEPELSAQAKEAKEEIRRSMAEHGGVLRASAADLIFRRKILTIPNLIRILLDIYQETGRLPFDAEETEDWKEKMMGMVRKEAGNDPRIAQVIETAAAMTAVDPLTLPDDAEVMSTEKWDQAMRESHLRRMVTFLLLFRERGLGAAMLLSTGLSAMNRWMDAFSMMDDDDVPPMEVVLMQELIDAWVSDSMKKIHVD